MLRREEFDLALSDVDLSRVCAQLKEHRLIDAIMPNIMGSFAPVVAAKITARGVDVVETGLSPDLTIDLMANQTINITGSNNIVGNNNQQSILNSVQELVHVIERSDSSPEEKAEATSLLKRFLEHPLLTALAGGAIGLLG